MISYVKGDLFETDAQIIAHGVNCQGAFGGGIAGLVSKLYPEVRNKYFEKFQEEGWELGDVQYVKHPSGKLFLNCATQDTFGSDDVHADYGAIRACMEKAKNLAKFNGYKLAIPKIGAGLAGGDWGIIEGILKDVFTDYDIFVYHL